MTCVDHHADDPFSIFYGRTSQYELVIVETDEFLIQVLGSFTDRAKCAFETIQKIVRRVTNNVALKVAELARTKFLKHWNALFLL